MKCDYEEHTLTVVNETDAEITVEVSGKTKQVAKNEEARFEFSGKPVSIQKHAIHFDQKEQIVRLGDNTFAQVQSNGSSCQICVRPALQIVNATDKAITINGKQTLQGDDTYVNSATCCIEIEGQSSE